MKEVEIKDGMMQLGIINVDGHSKRTVRAPAVVHDLGTPCASGQGIANPHSGREFSADTSLWCCDLDLGKMTLRWVADTKDPLFSRLSRYERQILYLYYAQEQSWKDIARTCRKAIKTIQDDYLKILEKIRSRAGVPGPSPLEDAAA